MICSALSKFPNCGPLHLILSQCPLEEMEGKIVLCEPLGPVQLCDLMDCSLPGSSVHGILQARTRVGCHSLLQGIFLTQASCIKGRFFAI